MLPVGQLAPEFVLRNQDDSLFSLAELLANGPLVVAFYPADFTPLCTQQACMLRDMHAELAELGIRVVGINADEAERHREFRDRHALPFDLLSDPEKDVCRLYGVDGPLGIGIRRATFLIGSDGYIKDAVTADVRISRHRTFIQKCIATTAA